MFQTAELSSLLELVLRAFFHESSACDTHINTFGHFLADKKQSIYNVKSCFCAYAIRINEDFGFCQKHFWTKQE